MSNWKKKTHKKYAQQKKKREIDLFIDPYRTSASISRGILVIILSNNVDDDDEFRRVRLFLSPVVRRLSDHRRVPPRVPLSSLCRSMAPEHVGCRDTRETPARGVGKERGRERERDLDVDSSATAWTRLGDEKRTARRDAVSKD